MSYIQKTRTYFKGSFVSKSKRESLLAVGKCMYCGSSELLHIDHILACSNGGNSNIENLTVACSKCNTQKSDFTLNVFLARIILKRDKVFNGLFRYTGNLAKYRRRKPHPEIQEWCIENIQRSRLLHSYYTRIIHSIITKKYIING